MLTAEAKREQLRRWIRRRLGFLLLLGILTLPGGIARSDVIVVANRSRADAEFRVAPMGQEAERYTVPPGQLVVVSLRGSAELLYDVEGNLIRHHLDANAAYYFANDNAGDFKFSQEFETPDVSRRRKGSKQGLRAYFHTKVDVFACP